MPKTKKTSVLPKSTPLPMAMSCGCYHHSGVGKCWMCWLFKSLIILFCAFLLMWIGFCFGILKNQTMSYYSQNSDIVSRDNRFCGTPDAMSRRMSKSSLEIMGQDVIKLLENTPNADFDQEFLLQMIVHHEGGIEMARLALEKSKDPEILKIAQNIIDKQTEEIETMKTLGK